MTKNEWKPFLSLGFSLKSLFTARPYVPPQLQMRKRDKDGKWIYREPTQDEADDYWSTDAW